MLDTSILDLTEPGIESGMSYNAHKAGSSSADWSRYAYIQYVADATHLCNSFMIFESLHRLGSKAERLMMYPEEWTIDSKSSDAELFRRAKHEFNVKLQPVHVQQLDGDTTWTETFARLLAFNQTQYDRVVSLDSDANVLQVTYVLYDYLCSTKTLT